MHEQGCQLWVPGDLEVDPGEGKVRRQKGAQQRCDAMQSLPSEAAIFSPLCNLMHEGRAHGLPCIEFTLQGKEVWV